MIFLHFLTISLFSSNEKSEVDYAGFVKGEWNISQVELQNNGNEKLIQNFQINITNTSQNHFSGSYNEYVIDFAFPNGNQTFDVSLSKDNKKIFEKTNFSLKPFGTSSYSSTGTIDELNCFYSLSILSVKVVEFTLFDQETKEITIFRFFKKIERKVNKSFLFMYYGFVLGIAIYFIYKQIKSKKEEKVKTD